MKLFSSIWVPSWAGCVWLPNQTGTQSPSGAPSPSVSFFTYIARYSVPFEGLEKLRLMRAMLKASLFFMWKASV